MTLRCMNGGVCLNLELLMHFNVDFSRMVFDDTLKLTNFDSTVLDFKNAL